MHIKALGYRPDTAILFSHWAQKPWAVFLDSGYPFIQQGRYDILAANPRVTLVTRGQMTEIRSPAGVQLSPDDPFALLQKQLGERRDNPAGLPFCGGAIGYFGYDLAWRLERLPRSARALNPLPEMAVGIYDLAVVVDHQQQQAFLVCRDRSLWPALQAQVRALWRRPVIPGGDFQLTAPVVSHLDRKAYLAAFDRIQHYIREGDCYQVNFAQRFSAPASGDPWSVYRELRAANPAPFGAFLRLPQGAVLSSSPERFLQVRDGRVETKPIKGTRPRCLNPEEDLYQAQALRESPKDRAENLMIVDLLRNDLGKNCQPGSVKVPKLFEVESFATVHHLVSTVIGQLRQDRHALDLLRGCFPGGSITGAPKLRAMEIIEELEGIRRGVYCGAIGYVGYDGAMDTNIVIRTLVHTQGEIHFWAGGGIVADSKGSQEYQESFDKAAALIQVLSRFRASRDRVGG
ncbi:para-aminobenzoate synthetase component I [Methylomarinovum caldicuralii]|uniref:aminodeoxychorismate synthase n=1 Tax=Methylomarinovum caldicuralii TaxID=438856 RepID=A0AAU9BTC6_9GAMM|nr:aminodeoxychorismate synthase component I [Methylomarinovum caldicuralii]BCX81866.1 para-aminobenzoate synthetase component I [Methylomarinovum caldicuralii]